MLLLSVSFIRSRSHKIYFYDPQLHLCKTCKDLKFWGSDLSIYVQNNKSSTYICILGTDNFELTIISSARIFNSQHSFDSCLLLIYSLVMWIHLRKVQTRSCEEHSDSLPTPRSASASAFHTPHTWRCTSAITISILLLLFALFICCSGCSP